MNKELGRIGNERGRRSEAVVAKALESIGSLPWPPWVLSGRMATREEDHQQIDAVIETDRGTMFLQIKSSKGRRVNKKLKSRGIGLLVVSSNYRGGRDIRGKIIGLLTAMRKR